MSVVHVILLQNEKNAVWNEKRVKSAVDHSATALVANESGRRHLIRHESAPRPPLYKNKLLFKKIIARSRGNLQKNEAHRRVHQNISHFMVLISSGKLGAPSLTLLVSGKVSFRPSE